MTRLAGAMAVVLVLWAAAGVPAGADEELCNRYVYFGPRGTHDSFVLDACLGAGIAAVDDFPGFVPVERHLEAEGMRWLSQSAL